MFKRRLFYDIINHLNNKEFSIIAGPRQGGKTTLLSQIRQHLKDRSEQVFFLNLEDPMILSKLNEHPGKLFDFFLPDRARKVFILIDEVQYLNDPSNFLKFIFDMHAPWVKLIASGSSAFYIDKKFKDSLAGRKRIFELYTLNFDEFLDFRTGNNELSVELNRIRENETYLSLHQIEIVNLFNEYLTFGGYPAVVLAPAIDEKLAILREMLFSFVKRDIRESGINSEEKFYRLMLLLAHQTGSLVNMNELSSTLKLSGFAVENYLYVMQKCYHIHLLRPFYRNIRKELTRMPKVYFHDLGLRNILMNQFNPLTQRGDKGEVAENYAFLRLREKAGLDALHFWRTVDGHEIDYIISETPDFGSAMEVKYDSSSFNPGKYSKFKAAYPGFPLECRSLVGESNKELLMTL